ncbi:MAG: hypothetical protein ACR2O2_16335 [Ruegeria sp.]
MYFLRILSMAASLVIAATCALADLVSPYGGETAPSFAELVVNQDHVRVALEIDLSAYPAFVVPDDGSGASLADRTGLTFMVEADGAPLDRIVRAVDVRPRIARQTAAASGAPARPRSPEVVFVEMEFPFEGQPETISFTPPLDPDGVPVASIGMLAEHMGVPVTDYRYLSRAEIMIPNWNDPWFSAFENPNLTRHHKSPLMSFLSMEPREVRHEIIFRLRDLEEWADLGLGTSNRLTPAELANAQEKAAAFFSARNPLTIDGTPTVPENAQVFRISVGADGLSVVDDAAPSNRMTELLGIVLSYPQQELANKVEMKWELFPGGIETVPVTLTDPAGGVPAQSYLNDPVVIWNNHLTQWEDPKPVPVVVATAATLTLPIFAILLAAGALAFGIAALRKSSSSRLLMLGLCGACLAAAAVSLPVVQTVRLPVNAAPNQAQAHAVLTGMFDNIRAAALETEDEGFQTALAPFVDAQHRGEVAAEIRRGLSVTLPSGALARTDRVGDIIIEDISQTPDGDATQILANWTANMSGGHWGHQHKRQVTYRGLIDVSQSGSDWYLDGLTVLSAQTEG